MNSYDKTVNHYGNQQIEGASPEQLLLLLYDGAIRFLNEALRALPEEDLETVNSKLIKAQNIVAELMSSLDMKVGGELAENLFRLYEYLHHRLIQANLKKDAEMIEEVLGHLKDLRETWRQAIAIAKKEEPTEIQKLDTSDDDSSCQRQYSV